MWFLFMVENADCIAGMGLTLFLQQPTPAGIAVCAST